MKKLLLSVFTIISASAFAQICTPDPNAVGLVKAKTGSLLGTVSMAGYVESPEHEYIFVAIADQIPRSERAAKLARSTLDKILAKLVV